MEDQTKYGGEPPRPDPPAPRPETRPYIPTAEELARLEKDFTYHAPKVEQLGRYKTIRDVAHGFARMLLGYCPPSRERSLALTNLEQAVMWANAAIARNEGGGSGA